jgi:hypothetical protein
MARIEHYEFGRIVVDGQEERRDLIILPDRVVRNWWRQDGHALVLEDLDEVLDDLPEHLVIGTGAHGRLRPDQQAVRRLRVMNHLPAVKRKLVTSESTFRGVGRDNED